LLVLFVAAFTLTACGGDNAKPVKEINVLKLNDDAGYILSWDAVGRNVAEYIAYAQLKDKRTVYEIWGGEYSVWEGYSVSAAGVWSETFVADKWYAYVGPQNVFITGDYHFGVRSVVHMGVGDISKIRWTKDTYNIKVD
jgi:hypothetical protein